MNMRRWSPSTAYCSVPALPRSPQFPYEIKLAYSTIHWKSDMHSHCSVNTEEKWNRKQNTLYEVQFEIQSGIRKV